MSMDKLSAEQRETGKDNFHRALGAYYDKINRRAFLANAAAVAGASAGLGALFYNYGRVADPVRVAVIGTGDEGNVLIGGCNPEYVDVVAVCDMRPYGRHRAIHGDRSSASALARRPGLMRRVGYKTVGAVEEHVKFYDGTTTGGIQECLDDPRVEAVIIALPLWLHAPVAAQAMKRGKHVLTEKLMAYDVAQCKVMARMASSMTDDKGNPLHLATGHQRHYNIKYDHAVDLMRWGLLGQVHHIRAQWHRSNAPGKDSWKMPLPGGEIKYNGEVYDKITSDLNYRVNKLNSLLKRKSADPDAVAKLQAEIAQFRAWQLDGEVDYKQFGYRDGMAGNNNKYNYTAMEEAHRWRLFSRTGAGLMAELGSHQLDAVSIFLSRLNDSKEKVKPLSVHAVAGRHTMPEDRDAGDHVYCTFEFPGPDYSPNFDVGFADNVMNYPKDGDLDGYNQDPDKKVVVTYSSINGNGFGGWGEVVMGTKGTLILDKEVDVLLYKDSSTSAKVGVAEKSGGYSLDTSASGDYVASSGAAAGLSSSQNSRGYQEEIEHWAYCIRNPDRDVQPRCHPKVALGDAVIAL
ncbi:MAG: Gfo/Idh/MocA family oxidoreductase, partial [Planctomycetota bacterium]